MPPNSVDQNRQKHVAALLDRAETDLTEFKSLFKNMRSMLEKVEADVKSIERYLEHGGRQIRKPLDGAGSSAAESSKGTATAAMKDTAAAKEEIRKRGLEVQK